MQRIKTFEDILGRIYKLTGTTSDTALAKILRIKPPSVAAARNREHIPPSWVIFLAEKYDVTTDWLFFGIGPMRREEIAPPLSPPPGEEPLAVRVEELEKELAEAKREVACSKNDALKAAMQANAAYEKLVQVLKPERGAARTPGE